MENLTYRKCGEYLIPELAADGEDGAEQMPIGKYGMLRRTYLKENRKGWYQSMMLSGKLDRHLMEIEQAATERMETLMKGLLLKYPAPDKEKDQMAWVAHMNGLTAMAEESILKELVYS